MVAPKCLTPTDYQGITVSKSVWTFPHFPSMFFCFQNRLKKLGRRTTRALKKPRNCNPWDDFRSDQSIKSSAITWIHNSHASSRRTFTKWAVRGVHSHLVTRCPGGPNSLHSGTGTKPVGIRSKGARNYWEFETCLKGPQPVALSKTLCFKGKYDCSIGFLAYAFVCSSTTPKEHHGPSHDRHQPQLPSPGRMEVMFLAWPWNINQRIFVFLVDKMDHYPSIHTESNPIQTNWV